MPTQFCSKCKEEKALDQFKKDKRRCGGYSSWCKKCANTIQRIYRQTEKGGDHKRAYDKKYRQRPHVKEQRRKELNEWRKTDRGKKACRKYAKKYHQTKRGHEVYVKASIKWRNKNPEKIKAQTAVHNAVRDGKLIKISERLCELCGVQAEHYHHDSYKSEDRLIIHPLCRFCHFKLHYT